MVTLDSVANMLVTNPPAAKMLTPTVLSQGFVNAKDQPEAVELSVSGELPGWLQGEHFTIGPGTYDIKFSRKIEVDGHLESATSTFTFGHWFDRWVPNND